MIYLWRNAWSVCLNRISQQRTAIASNGVPMGSSCIRLETVCKTLWNDCSNGDNPSPANRTSEVGCWPTKLSLLVAPSAPTVSPLLLPPSDVKGGARDDTNHHKRSCRHIGWVTFCSNQDKFYWVINIIIIFFFSK